MANPERISVEVVYALPHEQQVCAVTLASDSVVRDAIENSGVLERYPQIDLAKAKVGVFGRIVNLDAMLRAGDRVEIYRELSADPKVVRRQRVEKKRKLGRSKAP
jgi:putative ubiquitin-RnfH superfamily antitoxin RatB of RatAB toxin-antitoxin module